MILFVKILLAHLLGDFLLQPTSWVNHKKVHQGKSVYLYLHTFLHFLLLYLLTGNDFLPYAITIAISHGIIDYLKIKIQREHTERLWFMIDQGLHLIVLGLATISYFDINLTTYEFTNEFWIFATAIFALSYPVSFFIKHLISIWIPEDKNTKEELQNAGKYIGILERMFVFGFIVGGYFTAIGFLLAAKSIFRFGDLTQVRDRKMTEYVLIGTFISFGIAILLGLVTRYLLTLA